MGGTCTCRFGLVASQIILDNPLSIGDRVIANKNSARNARPNISSIPAETSIASTMTGINYPEKTITKISILVEVYTYGFKIESDINSGNNGRFL